MYVGVFVTFSKLIKLLNIVRFRKKKSHYENILITLVKVLKKILNLSFLRRKGMLQRPHWMPMLLEGREGGSAQNWMFVDGLQGREFGTFYFFTNVINKLPLV